MKPVWIGVFLHAHADGPYVRWGKNASALESYSIYNLGEELLLVTRRDFYENFLSVQWLQFPIGLEPAHFYYAMHYG